MSLGLWLMVFSLFAETTYSQISPSLAVETKTQYSTCLSVAYTLYS